MDKDKLFKIADERANRINRRSQKYDLTNVTAEKIYTCFLNNIEKNDFRCCYCDTKLDWKEKEKVNHDHC